MSPAPLSRDVPDEVIRMATNAVVSSCSSAKGLDSAVEFEEAEGV
jgi:hypothetical protein